MTLQEFSDKYLNKRQYGREITSEAEQIAKENGFVIVFAREDDICMIRGDIHCKFDTDMDCYFYIDHNKEIVIIDGDIMDKPQIINVSTYPAWTNYAWVCNTNIPHATFDIYDDVYKYCQGIVFETKEAILKLTNYEKIKTMNVDKLAEFIDTLIDLKCDFGKCDKCLMDKSNCADIKSWLESEVKT